LKKVKNLILLKSDRRCDNYRRKTKGQVSTIMPIIQSSGCCEGREGCGLFTDPLFRSFDLVDFLIVIAGRIENWNAQEGNFSRP
jgi:hypothetical protein